VIVRKNAQEYFGYVNSCPHAGLWLNVGRGFFRRRPEISQMRQHGSKFEIETGFVSMDRVKRQVLNPLRSLQSKGGLPLWHSLVEDDGIPDPFAEVADETMKS